MARFVVWLLLGIPYTLLAVRFCFTTDDAYISFRYARNLALGHGLRFNLAESPPVEGYSNFLWVLVCAVFEKLGLDVTVASLVVSWLCGLVLLGLVLDRLVRSFGVPLPVAALATATLAAFPPFAVWATSGLETMPFALCVFLAFDRLILAERPGWGAGLAALALALVRFEGVAWAGVLFAMAAVSRRRNLRALVLPAVIFAVAYGAYTGWRLAYHQDLLPNTARIKVGPHYVVQGWLRGMRYVAAHFLTFLTPFLLIPGTILALRRRSFAAACVAALGWAFPAYAVAVGGDFMAMGRFLVPGFVFQTVLTGWILGALRGGLAVRVPAAAAIAAIGLLPGWNIHLVPDAVRERATVFRLAWRHTETLTEYEYWKYGQKEATIDWARKGRSLARYVQAHPFDNTDPVCVVSPLGCIGYYSGLTLYDRAGLVTPDVSRSGHYRNPRHSPPGHDRVVPLAFFLAKKPELLKFALIDTTDPQKVALRCKGQERSLRETRSKTPLAELYAIDFAQVPGDSAGADSVVVVAWRSIEGDADAAWASFAARIDSLQAAGRQPSAQLLPRRAGAMTNPEARGANRKSEELRR